jgi:hypothetical protein
MAATGGLIFGYDIGIAGTQRMGGRRLSPSSVAMAGFTYI